MKGSSSYILSVTIPRRVEVEGRALSREDFYGWLWSEFGQTGLQGVHEGTLLSEEAAQAGLETESWTVDSGEAPADRDWMAGQEEASAELYFASEAEAHAAIQVLGTLPEVQIGKLREQKDEDWDAQWKASFLGNANGVKVSPFWRILPPWVTAEEAKLEAGEVILRINPGAGFGTGTHETTQLCLEAIGGLARRKSLKGIGALDFGSGSGILSIGAALLGAHVHGVEIDSLAVDNAVENAALNGVSELVHYTKTLETAGGPYPLVIANILRPVLIEFSRELVSRLQKNGGALVLSGLIQEDVAEIEACFSPLLGGRTPKHLALNEWRALVWEL